MLTNATITSFTQRAGQTVDGEELFATVALPTPAPRGFVDDPTSSQRWQLGATIKEASWSLYVPLTSWANAGLPAILEGDKLGGTLDRNAGAFAGQVILVKTYVLGGVSHILAFLKKV